MTTPLVYWHLICNCLFVCFLHTRTHLLFIAFAYASECRNAYICLYVCTFVDQAQGRGVRRGRLQRVANAAKCCACVTFYQGAEQKQKRTKQGKAGLVMNIKKEV